MSTATGTHTANSEGFDEEEDRPRFCSLDPPSDVYSRGGTRSAEFLEACGRGQLKEVKAMVEGGNMDLSQADQHGETPAHIAAGKRHCCDVLAYLLQEGANVNQRDIDGAVPLHKAASSRNVGGIRLLLQSGVEMDVKDKRGCTPLFAACKAAAHRAIMELMKRGANPTLAGGADAQTPLHALLRSSQGTKRRKDSNSGPSKPGEVGIEETVKALIDAGASMETADRSGMTVLDIAAASDANLLCHMLLECNLKPSNALTHAIRLGDASIAKELLEHGKVEPCTVLDCSGSSLLHVAATHGRLECARLLLAGQWLQREGSVPLNIDARDTKGRTALFNAATNAFVDVAAFLLDFGASPAIQDGSGAGVGYTFHDSVKAVQKAKMCELLQQWGARSEEERDRAESSASVKAPDGEVIYLSGEVPFVHNFKTKHLWATVNAPPPPAVAESKQKVCRVGLARQECDQNPWRGVSAQSSTLQDFDSVLEDSLTDHMDAEGRRALCGGLGLGDSPSDQQQREATKYAMKLSPPRQIRGKSLSSETKETESVERESRMYSEPGLPSGKKSLPKLTVDGRSRARSRGSTSRRRRGCSNSTSLREEESADRSRMRSTGTESTEELAPELSPMHTGTDSKTPGNQHRTLRPLAMDQRKGETKSEALAGDRGAGATSVLSPSAPASSKPSRVMKTF